MFPYRALWQLHKFIPIITFHHTTCPVLFEIMETGFSLMVFTRLLIIIRFSIPCKASLIHALKFPVLFKRNLICQVFLLLDFRLFHFFLFFIIYYWFIYDFLLSGFLEVLNTLFCVVYCAWFEKLVLSFKDHFDVRVFSHCTCR